VQADGEGHSGALLPDVWVTCDVCDGKRYVQLMMDNERDKMNITMIPVGDNGYSDGFKGKHTIRLETETFARFSIGGWDKNTKRRIEFDGPMVSGPYAFACRMCCVIDNFGGSAREARDAANAGTEHVVNFGDILLIDDAFYRVEDARLTKSGLGNDSLIKLVLVPRKDETLEMIAFGVRTMPFFRQTAPTHCN